MKTVQGWLDEYGESHQNPTNKKIHWICVPLIMLSLIGLLHELPVITDNIHWSYIFICFVCIYYIRLSIMMFIGMSIIGALLVMGVFILEDYLSYPLWKTSLIIFIVSWLGQFIGHKIEGKKPSFFQDIQFLLIGPLWLLSFVYNKIGIKY